MKSVAVVVISANLSGSQLGLHRGHHRLVFVALYQTADRHSLDIARLCPAEVGGKFDCQFAGRQMPPVARLANDRQKSTDAASNPSVGSTSCTSPIVRACSASICLLASTIQRAQCGPASRTNRLVPPDPGMPPNAISGSPRRAFDVASRKSAQSDSSSAPPKTWALECDRNRLFNRLPFVADTMEATCALSVPSAEIARAGQRRIGCQRAVQINSGGEILAVGSQQQCARRSSRSRNIDGGVACRPCHIAKIDSVVFFRPVECHVKDSIGLSDQQHRDLS